MEAENNMKRNIRIGVACLARETFDAAAAAEIYARAKETLHAKADVSFVFYEELLISTEQATEAGELFAASQLDGLVIISGTFHLGHLALILSKHVRRPILLWAFSELPYNGGKIRLNSVCGVNLNASNLYKGGVDGYVTTIGDAIDEDWLRAIRIQTRLRDAHVGLAGYRAHGFYNLDVEDLHLYRELGILIDHYELADMYQLGPAEGDEQAFADYIQQKFDVSGVTEAQTDKTARLAASMMRFMDGNRLDAVAVRCWPEYAATYGIAPCAAMALLTARGYTLGCEGDVEGTLSLLACRALSDEAPFMADLSQVDFEEDFALMWHCGVASDTLWDGKSVCSLDTYFAGGKGVTTDLVMKPGEVTVFRLDTARGKTRVFLGHGQAIEMEKLLRGTYAKVRFDKPVDEIFATVAAHGIAHHVAMVYGDYRAAFRKFAHIMGYEVIE